MLCLTLLICCLTDGYRHYRDEHETKREKLREIIEDYVEERLEDEDNDENSSIEVDEDDLDEFLFKNDPIRLTGRRSWRGRRIVREVTRPIRQTVDVIRRVVRVVPRIVRQGLNPGGFVRFRSKCIASSSTNRNYCFLTNPIRLGER